jgi:CRP-like cAMP-binding protein
LLLDRPRNATVTAVTETRLYALGREEFLPAVTGNPHATRAGHDLVRRRLEPEAVLPDASTP